jgi:lipopolysaccharide transport system permease protein
MSRSLKKARHGAAAKSASGLKPRLRPVKQAAIGAAAEPVSTSAPVQKAARAFPTNRITHIAAASPWYETGLAETIRSYELLLVFTWRQIGVQYKQAALGIGWALLAPLMSTIVFSFVFGKLGGMPSDGLPYPVFVLSGLLTWQFFARALSVGSNSILGNSHIITKVYFPRMILPLSAVLSGLVDYLVNLVVLVALMWFYKLTPGPAIVTLPVFVLLAAITSFAFGLWLSALNALYRDIGFMVPIVLQAWMFMTPVVYPARLVPADWVWIMRINPMTPIVEGARWSMLPGAAPPDLTGFAILAVEIIVLFFGGIVTFHKIDAILADRI